MAPRNKKPRRQLTPAEVKQLEAMAGLGLPMPQMASILGMSESSLELAQKKDAAVRQAIEKGRAMAEFNVTKRAYEMAIDGRTPAMTMFWLKCRARWKETQVTEITGGDGEPLFKSVADVVAEAAKIRERESKEK